jgi:N-formylglutamate amidohydrolase
MLGEAVFAAGARAERLRWIFDEGDPHTELIYHAPAAYNLHALVSRFVVDLNRFRDQTGNNGVIKVTDFEGRSLYPAGFELSELAREQRLRRYWDSFHAEIEACLKFYDVKLIIDGHSMQPRGPLIGPDQGRARPAITLMTAGDARGESLPEHGHSSISAEQAQLVMELLEHHFGAIVRGSSAASHTIALNDPWSLDETSYLYSDPSRAKPVPGFGIEFNRALYLSYKDGKEYPNEPVIKALNVAFQQFVAEVVDVF